MSARGCDAAPGAWRLADLVHGFATVGSGEDREVRGLTLDSRRIESGDLFFALAGGADHGARYVRAAAAAGAVAVAADAEDPEAIDAGIPVIRIRRLAERVGPIAARFYRQPARAMQVIGVTGTNGKTSCTQFLAQSLTVGSVRCGVIGTLGHGLGDEALHPTGHTTPDAVTLQATLAGLRARGATHVAMEVSSHALVQHRTAGTVFAGAVLTNLTHEHLDYHGDLEAYGRAKRRLFESPETGFAVINEDDALGRRLLRDLPGERKCVRYGLGGGAGGARGASFIHGRVGPASSRGLVLDVDGTWGRGRARTTLLGRFNASNVLAVAAVLLHLGLPLGQVLERIGKLRPVPGRMERFGGGGQPLVVVDYAHTPDALEKALEAVREHTAGRVICVFGCGGDRDRAKRPRMGAVAARLADALILTSDNPRSETPEGIIADIRAGIPEGTAVEVIADRGLAIRTAVATASRDDVVLVAGKGHEAYQEVAGQRLAFSDRVAVTAALGVVA